MRTISYTQARNHLAETMQQVAEKQDAVLIAQAENDSLIETNYLLRSPENARRLLRSIDQDHKDELRSVEKPDTPAPK